MRKAVGDRIGKGSSRVFRVVFQVTGEHPWAVLTDLEPQQAEVGWYGVRTRVETVYKDFKQGQWDRPHCKMQEASLVERLWLDIAVAQVWSISVGCLAEAVKQQEPRSKQLPPQHISHRRRKRLAHRPPPRRLSCVWYVDVWAWWMHFYGFSPAVRQARTSSVV